MKTKNIFKIFLVLLITSFLMGMGEDPRRIVNWAGGPDELLELIWKLEDAYEKKDFDTIVIYLSPEFKGGDEKFKQKLKRDFDIYDDIEILLYDDGGIGGNPIEEDIAEINTYWKRKHFNRTTNQIEKSKGKTTFIFIWTKKYGVPYRRLLDIQGDPLFGISNYN